MYQRKGYWFSPEERIAIVREFEKGGMSLTQIQAKYGIKGHSTVCKWRQNLQNSKKVVPLQPKSSLKWLMKCL
jgi:transposase-like protein